MTCGAKQTESRATGTVARTPTSHDRRVAVQGLRRLLPRVAVIRKREDVCRSIRSDTASDTWQPSQQDVRGSVIIVALGVGVNNSDGRAATSTASDGGADGDQAYMVSSAVSVIRNSSTRGNGASYRRRHSIMTHHHVRPYLTVR